MAFRADQNAAAGFVVTPSTNGAVTITCVKLYVGGTGGQYKNVQVIDSRGNRLAHTGVAVGSYISGLMIRSVTTTNTTATALIGYGPQ